MSRKAAAAAAGIDVCDLVAFEIGLEELNPEAVAKILKAMGYPPEALTNDAALRGWRGR